MRNKRLDWSRLICVGLTLFLVSACASGPKVSNDFVEQKANIVNVAVISDVAVAQDIEGDLNQVDVAQCKLLGKDVNRLIQSGLIEKGWSADNTAVPSVGIFIDNAVQFKVVNRPGEAEPVVQKAPFYVNEDFEKNAEVKAALKKLYLSLDKYDMKASDLPPTFLEEATIVGKHLDCDAMAVVMVGGTAVPLDKSLKEAIATSIMTLGMVSVWETSQVRFKFFVVDTKNGKVLLADEDYRKGGLANRKEILDMANELVEQVPKK